MKRIIVLFAKIDNVAVESHDFLLIVIWKPLGKSCLLAKRQAITLPETLAPVVACFKLPLWNPIFLVLCHVNGLQPHQ